MRAKVPFEQSLDHCLQELRQRGDFEACLRRYPQRADRLRPLLEVAQATSRYYSAVPQAPGGLVAGRERFLAVAAQQRQRGIPAASENRGTTRALGRKIRLAFPLQVVAAMLAIIVSLAILGGGAVWAAHDSLPGDLLYPVKLATEDVRLALASKPGGQVDLALQFVEERSEEIQALAAAGRQVPDHPVARMEQHIKQALTRTAWADDESLPGLLAQIAVRTRTQAQQIEQARANAPERARAGIARAAAVCLRGAEIAEAGLQDPKTFRWRYRHREGEPEPADEAEPDQERRQRRDQKQGGTDEPTPGGTPDVIPQRTSTQAGPKVTPQDPSGMDKPAGTPKGPGATIAPQPTPQGPAATDVSQPTPQGPAPTEAPQPSPKGPGPTEAPQSSPQGPGGTPEQPPQTSQPGSPGGGQGGN